MMLPCGRQAGGNMVVMECPRKPSARLRDAPIYGAAPAASLLLLLLLGPSLLSGIDEDDDDHMEEDEDWDNTLSTAAAAGNGSLQPCIITSVAALSPSRRRDARACLASPSDNAGAPLRPRPALLLRGQW